MTTDHVSTENIQTFLGLVNNFEAFHNIVICPKNNGHIHIQRGRNCRSKSVNNQLSDKFNRTSALISVSFNYKLSFCV